MPSDPQNPTHSQPSGIASPWPAICLAASLGGGAFALLAGMTLSLCALDPRFDRLLGPIEFLMMTVGVSLGLATLCALIALCVGVILAPLGAIVAWSLRIQSPAVYGGMLYCGVVSSLSMAPLVGLMDKPTAWEARSLALLFVAAMLIGQLAGFYARAKKTRLTEVCHLRRQEYRPRFSTQQLLASFFWYAIAAVIIHWAKAPTELQIYVYLLAVMQPITAWLLLCLAAKFPLARERTWTALQQIRVASSVEQA